MAALYKMALFGLITEEDNKAKEFATETKERLENNNLIKNPFKSSIRQFIISENDKLKILFVVYIEPVYFNFSVFGYLLAFGVFVIWGLTPWLIPGIALGLLGFFWGADFYYLMFRVGLRKKGYKGHIKRIRYKGIIEKVLLN